MKREKKVANQSQVDPLLTAFAFQPPQMTGMDGGGVFDLTNIQWNDMSPPEEEVNVPKMASEQWVSKVTSFSSEYTPSNWSAQRICGAPKMFPGYGDNVNCWCSKTYQNQKHHLELEFEKKVYIRGIVVLFNLCPNPITKVMLKTPQGKWKTVLQRKAVQVVSTNRQSMNGGKSTEEECKFVIKCRSGFLCNEVRIEMDTTGFNYWHEIDAVQLLGRGVNEIGDCCFMGMQNKRLLMDKKYVDVSFKLRDGAIITGHRCMIANRSKHFDALFQNVQKNCIELDEDPEIFSLFLEYIYTSFCKIDNDKIILCHVLARKYQQKDFEKYTGFYFQNILTDLNVVDLLDLCEKNNCELLVEYCLQYMADNYSSVLQSKDFAKVSKDNILKVCKGLAEKE